MRWLNGICIVTVVACVVACTQDAEAPATGSTPADNQQITTSKGYKISNPDEFGAAVALPTISDTAKSKGVQKTEGNAGPDVGISASAGSESSSSSEATGTGTASKPNSVKFNDDGTFKISYSDGSYLVGQWKTVDKQIQLTFGGDSALFDVKFPDADSIELWIKGATAQSQGGGAVSANAILMDPTSSSEDGNKLVSDFLNNTKGTWCYQSGNINVNDDAVLSFVQLGKDNIHVLLSFPTPSGSDYEMASLLGITKDASFELSYYHPKSSLFPKFSVNADMMTVAYAPLKKTMLKKISDGEAKCPNLPSTKLTIPEAQKSDEEKIFAVAKGTWCFSDGYVGQKEIIKPPVYVTNTVASLRFIGTNDSEVLLFETLPNGYGKASNPKLYSNGSFEMMSYYKPYDGDKADLFSIDGDVLTVKYASGKKSTLKRVSTGKAVCPDLNKFVVPKKLKITIAYACVDAGKTVTLTTDFGKTLTANPDGKGRFVVYLSPMSYFETGAMNGMIGFSSIAYVCTEDGQGGADIKKGKFTTTDKSAVLSTKQQCTFGPYKGNDPEFNSDVIVIYPYAKGKYLNMSTEDVPQPTCKKP